MKTLGLCLLCWALLAAEAVDEQLDPAVQARAEKLLAEISAEPAASTLNQDQRQQILAIERQLLEAEQWLRAAGWLPGEAQADPAEADQEEAASPEPAQAADAASRLFLQARKARDELPAELQAQVAERLQAVDARLASIARALLQSGHFDQGGPDQGEAGPQSGRDPQAKE